MSCACDIGLFLSGSRSAAVTEQSWLHVLKMVESVTRAGMGTIGFLPFWSSQSSSQYMQAGGKLFGSLGQRIYILVLHAHVRSGIHGTLDEARTEQREYVQRCGLWRWGRPRRRSCNERIHGSGRVGRESPAERGVQVDRPGSLLCSSSRAGRGGAPRTRTPHVASTWRCSPVAAALLSVMLLPGRLPPPYPPPVGGPLDPGSPVGWRLHV
jgi:hypothetical protein